MGRCLAVVDEPQNETCTSHKDVQDILRLWAEVRVYLRRPANRLWDRQREQQRKQRRKPTRVHFEGALCADIRVLINVPPWSRYQKPVSSIRMDAPESYVTRLDNDEPNVFWHTPARTKFSVDKLRDQPLTVKRIPIDEVETLMDWEEHCWSFQQQGDLLAAKSPRTCEDRTGRLLAASPS